MDAISYVRYSPHKDSTRLTEQLVEAYREVFSTEPWNEWKKCPTCERYWGQKDARYLQSVEFRHCGVPMVDFWPRETVTQDLFHEITPECSCWVAISDSSIIGFTWGYPIDLNTLEHKLGVPIASSFAHYFGTAESIAYQDEVGVTDQYREKKIAKALVAHRHADFLSRGLEVGVVRTRARPMPSVTYLWYTKKLGYKQLAEYPDGRVVLARRLEGLQELLHS